MTEFGDARLSSEEAEDMIRMVVSDEDNMVDYMQFVIIFTKNM